ncbi:MAG: hypothetical protein HZA13_06545 [Nitrospirae bacterium]|nr:hypothetical protein [Nitrospirota bacterium]
MEDHEVGKNQNTEYSSQKTEDRMNKELGTMNTGWIQGLTGIKSSSIVFKTFRDIRKEHKEKK